MIPYGMRASVLARALDVPANRVTEIIAIVNPVRLLLTQSSAFRAALLPRHGFG
jgi:plasmid maintenance system antidote protein VapI